MMTGQSTSMGIPYNKINVHNSLLASWSGRSPQSTKSSSHWISATCQTRPSNNCTKLATWHVGNDVWSDAVRYLERHPKSPEVDSPPDWREDGSCFWTLKCVLQAKWRASPTSLFSSSVSTSSGEAWVNSFRCKGVWKWFGTLRGRVPCQGDRWLQN